MLKKIRKTNWLIYLFCFIFLFYFLPITALSSTKAEETIYSNVLDDLQKDENFNIEDYPLKENDYTLQVIQVAESSDKELFLYVYQPSGILKNYIATNINLALDEASEDYHLHKLTYLNSVGVFYKYLVEDVVVTEDEERYYSIVSIYRMFDEDVDDSVEEENGNVINQVSFEVGKLFVLRNNSIVSFVTDVIEVTDKYVGFVRIEDGYSGHPGMGLSWYKPGVDSHFVAFNTDKNIDKLYEVKVFYSLQDYSYWRTTSLGIEIGKQETFGKIEEDESIVKYTENKVIHTEHGLYSGRTYTFDRIQTVDEFIKTEDREFVYEFGLFNVSVETKLTDEGLKDLEGMEWVVRFCETEWSNTTSSIGVGNSTRTKKHTIVGNVSLLQLKFETDGDPYNLGVVDNMQTGDGISDNETNTKVNIYWWTWVLIILTIILVLCAFFPIVFTLLVNILEWFIKGIWFVLKWIFKGIWYVISAPFSVVKKE